MQGLVDDSATINPATRSRRFDEINFNQMQLRVCLRVAGDWSIQFYVDSFVSIHEAKRNGETSRDIAFRLLRSKCGLNGDAECRGQRYKELRSRK